MSASPALSFCEFSCNVVMAVKPCSGGISDLVLPLCKIPEFIFVRDRLVSIL